jgi:hypothetical protein
MADGDRAEIGTTGLLSDSGGEKSLFEGVSELEHAPRAESSAARKMRRKFIVRGAGATTLFSCLQKTLYYLRFGADKSRKFFPR